MADQDMLHTAQLVKAALPFIDTRSKVMAELFVKVFELMGSMRTIRDSSNLAACGFEAGKIDVEGLLNGIRPICNLREIEIVDRILNFFKMKKMFEMYNNMMETMKTMQEFGGFNFQDAGTGADTDHVTGNFGGTGFESIFQSLKNSAFGGTENESNPSTSEEPGKTNESAEETSEHTSSAANPGGSNDKMMELLKTMIPQDKISTFENLSMLLNTMSYDSNSKPEQKESSDV